MRTSDFDFHLPAELIAQRPARPRDAARLLDARGETPVDRGVRDLPSLLDPRDLLVVNDTRVIPAQLTGRRRDARVGVTLHRPEGGGIWRAFARPAKRLREGDRIDFAEDFAATVLGREGAEVRLRFDMDETAFRSALLTHGATPLPPYIKRGEGGDPDDPGDYQTIFAAREGAVAAPTAGLHFTPAILDDIAARGIAIARVTLHVGAGTFLPVTADDVADHRMHAEYGEIDGETATRINAARAAGGRVVSIGTTALRLLESAAKPDGTVRPFAAETDIFITPGYRFRAVDLLFTNFHLPRSTLFMLVCAFSGTDHMRVAYAHAIAARYRFFSYGDAMLLQRAP